MTTVRENLIAAKALIDTPEKWGKGGAAFMPDNREDPLCILGACLRAGIPDEDQEVLRNHIPDGFRRVFIRFNDDPATTHADIMALFDRAIAVQPEA